MTTARLPISKLQPIIDTLSNSKKNSTGSAILVEDLFPKMLKLGDTQQSHILDAIPIMPNVTVMSSGRLALKNGGVKDGNTTLNQLYWAYEILQKDQEGVFNGNQDGDEQQSMVLVVYNDQVIGSLFGTAL